MSESSQSDFAASPFPPTAWTFIRDIPDPDSPAYRDSLNRLIASYWRPVFYFLRARGYPLHQAEDLTQGFFSRFYEKDLVHKADASRGKFRTFLLAVLRFYLSDQGSRAARQQRFDDRLVSIEALLGGEERGYEPASDETPETLFTRHYAAELIRQVHESLRTRCEAAGRADWYAVFAAAHLEYGPEGPPSQEELAARLGMTRDQVRYRLAQTEGWFNDLLRAHLRQEVGSDSEVGAEIRELQAALADR